MRVAERSLPDTLSDIPTLFGRLAYLASLRDPESGQYEHPDLLRAYDPIEADRILREMHNDIFASWLSLRLREQHGYLTSYLSSLNSGSGQWSVHPPLREFMPRETSPVERDLFLSELEFIFSLQPTSPGSPSVFRAGLASK